MSPAQPNSLITEPEIRDPRKSPLFKFTDLQVWSEDRTLNEEETRNRQDAFEARSAARRKEKFGERVEHQTRPIKMTSSILRKLKRDDQEARDQANAALARESLYVATEMPR